MYKYLCLFLFFMVYVVLPEEISEPAGYEIMAPMPRSVILSNLIRIKLRLKESPLKVRRVRFFTEFEDDKSHVQKKVIGEKKSPPFELVWDASGIPDQSWLTLYADVEYANGSIYSGSLNKSVVTLDRSPTDKDDNIRAFHSNRTITIDADFNDWPEVDSFAFSSSDNHISVKSVWNASHVYFAISIVDHYLYARPASKRISDTTVEGNTYHDIWMDDYVELCFDAKNDKQSQPDTDDREFLVSVDGVSHAIYRNLAHKEYFNKRQWHSFLTGIQCKVKLLGTLNNSEDIDTGYVIEVAIPWANLQVSPGKDKTIGFDIFNGDVEEPGSERIFASWSGVKPENNDNPSEWSNLILEKRSIPFRTIVSILLLLTAILVFILRSKKTIQPSKKEYTLPVQKTIEFINQTDNYNFSMNDVSKRVGLSYSHFKKVFKKETGSNFTNYLMHIKMEKAKTMLSGKTFNISQIAQKLGYHDISHFSKIFKKHIGTTPLDYRKKF